MCSEDKITAGLLQQKGEDRGRMKGDGRTDKEGAEGMSLMH
jgi:hypothetical protein